MTFRSNEMHSPVSLALAGIRVLVFPVNKASIERLASGYGSEFLAEDAPVITIRMTQDDIAEEKELTFRIRERAGMKPLNAEDGYYEWTALFKNKRRRDPGLHAGPV